MILLVAATILINAGNHTMSLRSGGVDRSNIVHVPANGRGPLPVVINFQGGGGDGAGQQKYSQMDRVADREHFLVIYPTGVRRTWNAGTCCAYAMSHQIDDVGFVRAIIDDVAKQTPIARRDDQQASIAKPVDAEWK